MPLYARVGSFLLLLCLIFFAYRWWFRPQYAIIEPPQTNKADSRGKVRPPKLLLKTYTIAPPDSLLFPLLDARFSKALEAQAKVLMLRNPAVYYHIGALTFSHKKLQETVYLLRQWQYTLPCMFKNLFNYYQLSGEDKRGNIRFTGYFTPLVKASKQQNDAYPFPIAIRSEDSEETKIFVSQKTDERNIKMQGSAYVEFLDKKRYLLKYNGKQNILETEEFVPEEGEEEDATEIEKQDTTNSTALLAGNDTADREKMTGSESVFLLENAKSMPQGASGALLTPGYSVAGDKSYLPFGACFLAAVPITDENGRFKYHEYRFLAAQDAGSGVKGKAHVDLYVGVGAAGERVASNLNHYGQMWLILAK